MYSTEHVCWDEESFELLEEWEGDCEEESSFSFRRLLKDDGSNIYDDEGTQRDSAISLLRSGTASKTVAESYTLHTPWIPDLRTVESVAQQQQQLEKASSGELDEYM
jgi:hypothetical protein